jgi:hypothetical protein
VPGGTPYPAPVLPLGLGLVSSLDVHALLDTGSTVNLLPYGIGVQLGADWAGQTIRVPLAGSLAGYEARALLVSGLVAHFPAVPLAFAWADTDDVPLLLGQINFFQEFDVCFFRSRLTFEVRPKPTAP